MCSGFRVDTAIDGSFCCCKNGSPFGHFVPDTMLTFCPATCAVAGDTVTNAATHANASTAHTTRTDNLIVRLLESVISRSLVAALSGQCTSAGLSEQSI